MGTDSEAIKDVLRRYASTVNDGDFESWIGLWESNGCQMPPGVPCRVGVEAIRRAMQPNFESMNLTLDLVSIDEAPVFGDLGLTRCTYSLEATPKEGGDTIAVEPNGKALTLYRRQGDGSWKIAYDCFNSNVS
jgi:ketosteroid isomerase-like protein